MQPGNDTAQKKVLKLACLSRQLFILHSLFGFGPRIVFIASVPIFPMRICIQADGPATESTMKSLQQCYDNIFSTLTQVKKGARDPVRMYVYDRSLDRLSGFSISHVRSEDRLPGFRILHVRSEDRLPFVRRGFALNLCSRVRDCQDLVAFGEQHQSAFQAVLRESGKLQQLIDIMDEVLFCTKDISEEKVQRILKDR